MCLSGQAARLFTGAPVEEILRAGQSHTYELPLTTGQFADLKVFQQAGDVTVAVRLPDGAEYGSTDRVEYDGFEDLPWIAATSGNYRIVVTANKGPDSRYRIEADVRPPSESDTARASGFRIGWVETRPLRAQRSAAATRKLAAQLELAIAEFRKAGDTRREAYALTQRGEALFNLSQLKAALPLYLRAAELQRALPDERVGLAASLVSLATLHTGVGEVRKAIAFNEEALQILPADGGRALRAMAISGIGNEYARLGQNDKALEYKLRALALRREIGDRLGEGSSNAGLATFYYNLRDLQKAIEAAAEALRIFLELKEETWEARVLFTLGMIHGELQERDKANEYWARAEEIYRHAGNEAGLAGVLYGKGGLALWNSDYPTAGKALEEATALYRKTGYRAGLARALAGLCDYFGSTGQWERSKQAAEEGLEVSRQIASPIELLKPMRCLAQAAMKENANDKAEKILLEAVTIARRVNDRGEEMRLLMTLSRLAERKGDVHSGIAYLEQSAAAAETDALQLPTAELRTRYRASRATIHASHLDILMRQHEKEPAAGYAERAFDVSERARARSLAELISGPGRAAVLTREQRAHEAGLLAKLAEVQRELFRDAVPASRRDELRAALSQAERELDLFQSVAYAGKEAETLFEAWDTVRTRRELAGPDGAVVAYSLGSARSYVWVLTAGGVASAVLPPRKQIEQRVAGFRALLAKPAGALTAARAMAAIDSESRAIYALLLGPVASAIAGKKRLLFVPDGALAFLPFEVLGDGPRLIERVRVAYAPSASTAGALRQRGQRRAPAAKMLLAFADPNHGMAAPAGERGFLFTALPNARAEVAAIGSLFPSASARTYFGNAATEQRLKSESLGDFRYLHFAAHGYFDESEPARSGIVLAQGAGAVDDGFLQAREVSRLHLNSDLVTLSACQSGLGKMLAGEGVQGLARAFFHAGAQSVLVSLWNVNDSATADLMKRFYTGLKAGLSKEEALQAAKLAHLRAPGGRWRHPYFWAPFVLIGEPR